LVGHRICRLVANDEEEPRISVSVGVVSYPKDAVAIGTLLYAADQALYAMKHESESRSRLVIVCNPLESGVAMIESISLIATQPAKEGADG